MRRVVVTGLGVIAPNGNGIREFELALRKGRSGIRFQQIMADAKFASQVAGVPEGIDELAEATFSEAELMVMNMSHRYASLASLEAWTNAGLEVPDLVRRRRGDHLRECIYSTRDVASATFHSRAGDSSEVCRGKTQAAERWKTVTSTTSSAIPGSVCAALAPVPTIATRRPASSWSWSHSAV